MTFKNILSIALIAATLFLAGCNSDPTIGVATAATRKGVQISVNAEIWNPRETGVNIERGEIRMKLVSLKTETSASIAEHYTIKKTDFQGVEIRFEKDNGEVVRLIKAASFFDNPAPEKNKEDNREGYPNWVNKTTQELKLQPTPEATPYIRTEW